MNDFCPEMRDDVMERVKKSDVIRRYFDLDAWSLKVAMACFGCKNMILCKVFNFYD
jgi:hypothetical protein